MRRRGGLRVSVLDSGSAGFEPWPGSLCCVLWQDTLLSQCFSSPRCANGYQQMCWEEPCDKLASHLSFMLRKPELSTEISVRRYFPRLDYQPLFRLTPKVMAVLPYMSIKWEDMENDVLGFLDLFERQRDILFTGSPLFYVNSLIFFFACLFLLL